MTRNPLKTYRVTMDLVDVEDEAFVERLVRERMNNAPHHTLDLFNHDSLKSVAVKRLHTKTAVES